MHLERVFIRGDERDLISAQRSKASYPSSRYLHLSGNCLSWTPAAALAYQL